MMKKIFFILLVCFSQAAGAATLSAEAQQIHDFVMAHQQAQIQLLAKLVDINSGTTNVKGVNIVGKMIEAELQTLGFKTWWVAEPARFERAGTLLAERVGTQGKPILLIGHLDTVFANSAHPQQFEIHGNSAKGPGSIDDKGGVVVMLYALKALQAMHALENTSIAIALTGDEEQSGKPTSISRKPLKDIAQGKAIALDFEPSISLDTATIGRRGISNWTITSSGNESHSATIFQRDVGDGAIFEIARILNMMRLQLQHEKDITFNPGLIIGGNKLTYDHLESRGSIFGKQNVVAKTALVTGDVRYLTEIQKKQFEQQLLAIVNQHLPGTHAQLAVVDGIPPMAPTANNLQLLEAYSAASERLNLGKIVALDPSIRGAGDISYVAPIIPANLSGLGPTGIGTHSVIEAVELPSLAIQTQRAAQLIYQLTR